MSCMINSVPCGSGKKDVRSLLSSETLEDNLGVSVNAKVVHSLSVSRAGRGRVCPALRGSSIAKGSDGVTADGLHGCLRERKKPGKGRSEKRGEV